MKQIEFHIITYLFNIYLFCVKNKTQMRERKATVPKTITFAWTNSFLCDTFLKASTRTLALFKDDHPLAHTFWFTVTFFYLERPSIIH